MTVETKIRKQVTIKDVAARAGVNHASVSVVLNGSRSSAHVSPAARERILAAAEELGYRPHLAARSMRRQRSQQVGVLVRNTARVAFGEILSHPMSWEMVLGISEGLESAGYMMSLVRLSDVDPERHLQASAFQGHLLDGLIVVNDVPAAPRERLESLVPECVWLDSNVDLPERCLRRDERHAGETAARALIEAGCRRLVVLRHQAGDSSYPGAIGAPHYSAVERMQGIADVARAAGTEIVERDIPWTDDVPWSEILPGFTPDCGVVPLDAYLVYRLYPVLLARGIQPGRDFALACPDDGFHTSGMGFGSLGTAHVSFPRFEMGQAAAEMLLRRLAAPEIPCPAQRIRGEWIPGASVRSPGPQA